MIVDTSLESAIPVYLLANIEGFRLVSFERRNRRDLDCVVLRILGFTKF